MYSIDNEHVKCSHGPHEHVLKDIAPKYYNNTIVVWIKRKKLALLGILFKDYGAKSLRARIVLL